ncbi:chitin-binding domain protein cbd-1 [Lingula anatina]|uniref:Chitin-binding domain protein cbd-1 n=1 Tax=Lingula anatina TaxID=7574 RepID=A0A1S3IAE9_LINAN|nr:chitin-binding domain protein cbd-1 [Lingula anatina]|eukprot:XP_013394384.1 chitin-binding domain protein cbd-1 [Lingula anatina]
MKFSGEILACLFVLGLIALPASTFECPKKRSGLFRDPEDCGKFYQCYKGLRSFRLNCPAGLHFNNRNKRCDYPKKARCQTQVPVVTTQNTPFSGTPKFTCPKPFGLYPDAYNCSRFYQCSYSKAFIKVCPFQLQFNARLHVCDFAESAGCVALSTTTSTTAQTTPSITAADTTVTNGPTDAISTNTVADSTKAATTEAPVTSSEVTQSSVSRNTVSNTTKATQTTVSSNTKNVYFN